ncbi:hypothetical protein BDZ89DRAFT_944828 [Hymenopellis radicata]|nr:hypothetical protein BDZ89DRAFT_944828 [Hymenopellis radicata]
MSVRHIIVHKQPHTIANAVAFGTGLAAISAGTLLPVTLHLASLLVYGPVLLHRRHTTWHAFALGLSLALSKTVDWAIPAWHALSNPTSSLAILFLASTVTSGVTVGVLLLHTWARSRIAAGWSQVVLFPALWAYAWYFVSLISPIGRLSSWAPVSDPMGYEWMIPFTGPTLSDWVTAAWAVVLSEVAGAWLMGSTQAEEDEETPLLPDSVKNAQSQSHRGIGAVSQLAVMLLVMMIPSFVLLDARLPVESPDTTALRVACILPPRPAHRGLDIQDYLRESSRFWNTADVLLWPEGAVTFESEAARNAAFSNVIELLKNNSKAIMGVSYTDTSSDSSDPTGKKLLHRNGLALLSRSSPEPHLEYYKRNLVPIAESYGMIHSSEPPEMFTYELQISKKEERPIPITTSICLDFAMPNTFAQLQSKPALILAPAKTWDRSVAQVMWEQAKQRALELDSTVLWCDGGESGLSGVAGKGQDSEPMQIGEGSWTRAIGVEFPFNERRTVYGAGGNAIAMSLFFGLIAVGMVDGVNKLDWEKINLACCGTDYGVAHLSALP